jgi:hypothetical protein
VVALFSGFSGHSSQLPLGVIYSIIATLGNNGIDGIKYPHLHIS